MHVAFGISDSQSTSAQDVDVANDSILVGDISPPRATRFTLRIQHSTHRSIASAAFSTPLCAEAYSQRGLDIEAQFATSKSAPRGDSEATKRRRVDSKV